MLKRIPIASLRVGMFVQELGGPWLDHPSWRDSFKIDSAHDLNRVLGSGIHEAWIDTERGLDVAGGLTQEESNAEVERDLIRGARVPSGSERIEMAAEVAQAAKITATSCKAVAALFQEARMGKAIHVETVLPVVDDIAGSVRRNPGVLIALSRLRRQDNYTYLHSVSVCALMVALANQLGLDGDRAHEAGLAGLLHDIGKVHIPLDLLNKKGTLSEEEFADLKRHPAHGHEMLLNGGGAGEVVLDVSLHHHERVDGTGYPHQLAGDGISMFARMAAVCDVYDATTSNRPYKAAWQPAHALRKMTEWSNGHFDKRVFHAFVRTVGIYPIGTLVRLKSNRLGVVIDQSNGSLLTPWVKVFFSIDTNRRLPSKVVNLASSDAADEIVSHEDPAAWGLNDLATVWSGLGQPNG